MKPLRIDGSYGEGGGQVLRTSLSLACILRRECIIERIRAGRTKPGLSAQHLTCVRAAAAITGAEVEGDYEGSQMVRFAPHTIRGGEYTFDVAQTRGSAGAVTLLYQTVLPALLFAGQPSNLLLRGGTNVAWSPPYEYIAHVFLPALARSGVKASVERTRAGWYPAGGGEIVAKVSPVAHSLEPVQLRDRGRLCELTVFSIVSKQLPEHILERQATSALKNLPPDISRRARCVCEQVPGGPGAHVVLAAQFDAGFAGGGAIGDRGKRAETVGSEAAREFSAFLAQDAAVDLHLADQLLLYAALADGDSVMVADRATDHLRTNAWVIQQFLDIPIAISQGAPARIEVSGAGIIRPAGAQEPSAHQ